MNSHIEEFIQEIREDFENNWQEDMDILEWFRGAVKGHLLIESDEEAEAIVQDILEGIKAYRGRQKKETDKIREEIRVKIGDKGYQEIKEELDILVEKLVIRDREGV